MSLRLIASILGLIIGSVLLLLGLLTPLATIPFCALGIGILYLCIRSVYRFDGRS